MIHFKLICLTFDLYLLTSLQGSFEKVLILMKSTRSYVKSIYWVKIFVISVPLIETKSF